MEVSNGLVIALGLGIVFIGLVAIIAICYIMGFVCKLFVKPEAKKPLQQVPAAAPVASRANNAPIANKQEIIAGVCAVIAEELGTDVSNIRVTSFKRV